MITQYKWYKIYKGKRLHAFEAPAREHTALCGSVGIPTGVYDHIDLNDEYIKTFEMHRFCSKCLKKLNEMEKDEIMAEPKISQKLKGKTIVKVLPTNEFQSIDQIFDDVWAQFKKIESHLNSSGDFLVKKWNMGDPVVFLFALINRYTEACILKNNESNNHDKDRYDYLIQEAKQILDDTGITFQTLHVGIRI